MQPNGDGLSRLDRIEKILEMLVEDHVKFREEHKLLLTAQVVLTDRVDRLAQAQQHTEERLNALITIVDGIIRHLNRPE